MNLLCGTAKHPKGCFVAFGSINRLSSYLYCALLTLLLSQPVSAACLSPELEKLRFFEVETVYDGDTVRLMDGRRIRLIGVNAPEMEREKRAAEPLAEEATAQLRALLGTPATIGLRPGSDRMDRYGRTLAHAFTPSGEDIAATLVGAGLGFALVIPPNLWNSECYVEAEQRARGRGKGVWSNRYYHSRPLSKVNRGGFQRITGRVERVDWSRQWLWLDMGHQISIQIAKNDLAHFEGTDLQGLKGETITLQGWLVPRKRGYRMRLYHPSAMKLE